MKSVYKEEVETDKFSISVQYIYTRASSCWTETTSPTPPISLVSTATPQFHFHLLLHKHTKIMMVRKLEGSPLSSAYLQGQFDTPSLSDTELHRQLLNFSTPDHVSSLHRTPVALNNTSIDVRSYASRSGQS